MALVLVAIIGAVATVASSSLPAWLNRRDVRHVSDRMGEPNGQGSLVAMIERCQRNDLEHDRRLDRIERSVHLLLRYLPAHVAEPRPFNEEETGAPNGIS